MRRWLAVVRLRQRVGVRWVHRRFQRRHRQLASWGEKILCRVWKTYITSWSVDQAELSSQLVTAVADSDSVSALAAPGCIIVRAAKRLSIGQPIKVPARNDVPLHLAFHFCRTTLVSSLRPEYFSRSGFCTSPCPCGTSSVSIARTMS